MGYEDLEGVDYTYRIAKKGEKVPYFLALLYAFTNPYAASAMALLDLASSSGTTYLLNKLYESRYGDYDKSKMLEHYGWNGIRYFVGSMVMGYAAGVTQSEILLKVFWAYLAASATYLLLGGLKGYE